MTLRPDNQHLSNREVMLLCAYTITAQLGMIARSPKMNIICLMLMITFDFFAAAAELFFANNNNHSHLTPQHVLPVITRLNHITISVSLSLAKRPSRRLNSLAVKIDGPSLFRSSAALVTHLHRLGGGGLVGN